MRHVAQIQINRRSNNVNRPSGSTPLFFFPKYYMSSQDTFIQLILQNIQMKSTIDTISYLQQGNMSQLSENDILPLLKTLYSRSDFYTILLKLGFNSFLIKKDYKNAFNFILDYSLNDYFSLLDLVCRENAIDCAIVLLDKINSDKVITQFNTDNPAFATPEEDRASNSSIGTLIRQDSSYLSTLGNSAYSSMDQIGNYQTESSESKVGRSSNHHNIKNTKLTSLAYDAAIMQCAMLGHTRIVYLLSKYCTQNTLQEAFYEAISYDNVEVVMLLLKIPGSKILVNQKALTLAMQRCGKSLESETKLSVLNLLIQSCREIDYVKYLSSDALRTLKRKIKDPLNKV